MKGPYRSLGVFVNTEESLSGLMNMIIVPREKHKKGWLFSHCCFGVVCLLVRLHVICMFVCFVLRVRPSVCLFVCLLVFVYLSVCLLIFIVIGGFCLYFVFYLKAFG